MIEIKNLTKKFGTLIAVNDINLTIKKGTFYCLLGPNGAGKTTTLKILAGLMQPTSGEIFFNGLSLRDNYFTIKKILGFIPDEPFLYENLTVKEFLEFIADVFEVEKKVYSRITEEFFRLFNLGVYRNSLIKEISHGTRQKIVYLANFLHEPLIYLIDEPFVGLDPYSIYLIKDLLKKETQKGKTVLMSTHLLSVADELADCIGIMDEGKLIVEDNPQKLKEKMSLFSLEKVFLKLTEDQK